ncbi:MAG: DUF4407 domain-containing protein [Bacteroidota bacterium]
MKQALYNFFVWCAGSDRAILDRCGQSEHTKHAGYGGLVLVPAILGFVSMTYAVSTLTPKPLLYIGAGFIWAIIVFIFDRFIVSTFRKSESLFKDVFSLLFLSRIAFAIGIGILVSHPMVLLVFDDSLEQELTNMRIESEDQIRNQYDQDLAAVRLRQDGLKAEVNEKIEYRQCLERLLLFEMSGKDTTMACGTTSGLSKYGPRAREIKEEIGVIAGDIDLLREQNASASNQNEGELAQLLQDRDQKLNEFQFSTNYLAREVALSRLEQKEIGGSAVTYTKWFLLLFFILVDILPVVFKVVSKYGEYDRRLDLDGKFDIKITNAYEREQEERVRKAYVDGLTDLRIRKIEEEINHSAGNYEDLMDDLEVYTHPL